MGAEIVQRLFGPGVAREIADERPRLRHVLVVLTELAQRGEIEESRFGLPRRTIEVRAHAVAGGVVALQMKVTLGDAQIGELAIIAAGLPLNLLERRPGFGVAARSEQHGRPAEILLVAGLDDLVLQGREMRRGGGRKIRQRELVIDPQVGRCRCLAVAGAHRHRAKPRQHVIRDEMPVVGNAAVDRSRIVEATRGFRRFAERQRRVQRDRSDGLAAGQRLEGAPRLRELLQTQLDEALVVVDVIEQRRRRRQPAERGLCRRVLAGVVELDGRSQGLRRGIGASGAIRSRGDEPQIAFAGRKRRMLGRSERRLAHGPAGHWCRRR